MQRLRKQYLIKGDVQGVFFRVSTCEKARELGVLGWVRNLEDGQVEVYAEADAEKMAIFYRWLNEGPPMAKVNQVLELKVENNNKRYKNASSYDNFFIL